MFLRFYWCLRTASDVDTQSKELPTQEYVFKTGLYMASKKHLLMVSVCDYSSSREEVQSWNSDLPWPWPLVSMDATEESDELMRLQVGDSNHSVACGLYNSHEIIHGLCLSFRWMFLQKKESRMGLEWPVNNDKFSLCMNYSLKMLFGLVWKERICWKWNLLQPSVVLKEMSHIAVACPATGR